MMKRASAAVNISSYARHQSTVAIMDYVKNEIRNSPLLWFKKICSTRDGMRHYEVLKRILRNQRRRHILNINEKEKQKAINDLNVNYEQLIITENKFNIINFYIN